MRMSVEKLGELNKLAKLCGLEDDKSLIGQLKLYAALPRDYRYEKIRAYCLLNSRNRWINNVFPIPVSDTDMELARGQFLIGKIAHTDMDFGITKTHLNQHLSIFGKPGSGKTTVVKILAQQIIQEGKIKMWIIDPKAAGDFRFLARMFPDTVILPKDKIRCNPFSPIPNVRKELIMEAMSNCTADAYGLYDSSEGVLIEHFARVLREHEVPSFYDFAQSLSKEKVQYGGRRGGYVDTLTTRKIKTILSMGSIVNCRVDNIGELYDRNVVFEIAEISGAMQYVLTAWIVTKLMLYKRKNPTPYITHIIVFDEGQGYLLSRNLELRGRTSSMATFITQCRAFGLGVVVLAQNPTKLMTEIIGNSSKICMHLGSGMEIQEMSKHMGLTYEQMDTFYRLNRQQAIARLGLDYMEPVMVDISDFYDQPMDDAELEQRMKPTWDMLLQKMEPVSGQMQLPGIEMQEKDVPEDKAESPKNEQMELNMEKAVNLELSPDEVSYLRVVASHPWHLLSEIYAIVGDTRVMGTETIGQSKAVKLRKGLLNKGYLITYDVIGTGRSGRSYSDLVTEKAGMGRLEKPRGGYLHAWWCNRVSAFLKKDGDDVKIGDTTSGNELDITAKIQGKRLGLEVVLSSFALDNVPAHLKYCDQLIVLVPDEDSQKKVTGQIDGLGKDIQGKVKVSLLNGNFDYTCKTLL